MNEEYKDKDIDSLFEEVKSSPDGLSEIDAKYRLNEYGVNELPKEKKKNLFHIFLNTFNDPIIYILIIACILSFVGKEVLDACAIVLIILIDSIVSTIQEYSASKNSEALKNLIKVICKVKRDGKIIEIDSSLLVPGDVVEVDSGTMISADMRIISSTNLTIDESVLTGESIGVVKDSNITDNINNSVLFAGTSVLTGRGTCIVCKTGINTEIGKIALKVTNTTESKSPLTIRMEKFSKQISIIIVAISVIIAIVLYYKNYQAMEIFLSVVALSVSAMPEGLPLALTMALTIGSKRMGKRNVIVKKLNSVESLGSCTVIATDKTGTLTVNEQTAKIILLPDDEEFEIEGNGYNDIGKVICKTNSSIKNAKFISKLGFINNEGILEKDGKNWKHLGDSIDIAFIALANKLGVQDTKYKRLKEIPYESEKKYSALFYEENDKKYCTAKGSVEEIIKFCDSSLEGNKKIKLNIDEIMEQNNKLAECGYRVLALCNGKINKDDNYGEEDIKSLSFVGLVGFIDPVRKETINSVKECKAAGIKVIMVTGDHALTAYAIAKELKIVDSKNDVVTGEDINRFNDDKNFDKFIKNKTVFARVTPLDKLRIVKSLERMGEFVAVTGDGVNDAPAIKAANIGIAMGSGTDVAKETANMIIVDNNFSSIVAGIEEGRNAYSNIRKISILLLSCGLAEVLFFLFSIIFNMPLPLVAIQLLWLNLVTDGFQDMALSFERETDVIMKEKPRSTKESLFEKELIKQILISGVFMGVMVFIVWYFLINIFGIEASEARGYILALMVFMQNMHVLSCRSESKSVFVNGFKNNKFVLLTIIGTIGLQMIVMEVPALSNLLQTSSIPYGNLIILFFLALPVVFVMETYKLVKVTKKSK